MSGPCAYWSSDPHASQMQERVDMRAVTTVTFSRTFIEDGGDRLTITMAFDGSIDIDSFALSREEWTQLISDMHLARWLSERSHKATQDDAQESLDLEDVDEPEPEHLFALPVDEDA